MDPITHCLTGGMLAKTVWLKAEDSCFEKRLWFWSFVFAAEAPDADIFFEPLGLGNSPFFYHRGFTHSILGALVLGGIAAVLFHFFITEKFLKLWGIYSSIFLTHVLGDWLTSYGTPLFSPFLLQNYSLDLLSNLTLAPMAIFFFSLLLTEKDPPHFKRWLYGGWIAFFVFVGVSAFWRHRSLEIIGKNAIASLPDILVPIRWVVVKSSLEDSVYETHSVSVWPGTDCLIGKYPALNHIEDNQLRQILTLPKIKKYLWFNRWPVARIQRNGSESVIEIGNLLYRHEWEGKGVLGGALRITTDADGALIRLERTVFKSD